MQSSAQTQELKTIFQGLDHEKKGYITMNIFQTYINHQPRKLDYLHINTLFELLPDKRMNEQAFITYMMGYRMKMEQFALGRFSIEKELSKHISASPSSGVNQIRKSSARFSVASKKNPVGGEKHKFSIQFGKDEKYQSQRYEQFAEILGRKPEQVIGLIKFKVTASHQIIRQGLQTIIETAKGILTQMDEQTFRIMDMFKFTVKSHGDYIYIFAQVGHVFVEDMVRFLNEMIQALSPDGIFKFRALIQSNYLKDILKEGSEKKMQDLQVKLNLDFDEQTMGKVKGVLGKQIQDSLSGQQVFGVFLLLFKQANIQAEFSNSQKLFNQLGLSSPISEAKTQLLSLKEMSLLQNLQGFIPESKQIIENLKKYGKGDGQISINLRNIYLKIDFNAEIQGILDLL